MQNADKFNAAVQQIDVLLFDEFSGHCLANTVEPMRAANSLSGQLLYRWRFLTVDQNSATSSAGMAVRADAALRTGSGDMLIVMPSYNYRKRATAPVLRALRAAAKRYDVVAGFDSGAWLLAAAGLLEGRRATIHWEELSAFAEDFPEIDAQRARHIRDGDRVTCSGAMAAFDLMLELIAQHHGPALRFQVATLFMSPDITQEPGLPEARSRGVASAVQLMQESLEAPLPLSEIARRIGRGVKDLERRMKQELGAPPGAIYRRLRLLQARKLVLETDLGVAEIALRCGYDNPSAMTRAFGREFDTTPQKLRRARG